MANTIEGYLNSGCSATNIRKCLDHDDNQNTNYSEDNPKPMIKIV